MTTPRTIRPGMSLDPGAPINNGLVGWWPMWEGAGGKTLDISGKNNHGTLTNGPLWSGGGLKFDGTDDYVAVGAIGDVQNVSYRIKPSVNKYSVGISANKRFLLNNGLYSGADTATRYINGAIPAAESLGSELLTNGTLESGAISPWTANLQGGATGTTTITTSSPYAGTYAADNNITNAGTAGFHWQMVHNSNFSLTSGNLYKVQFAAKGSAAKSNLGVSILESTGFTAMAPSYAFDLTTSWVLHTYYFYSEQTKSDVKLYFNLGANGVYHAYFDNISIKPVSSVGDVKNNEWNFVSVNLDNPVSADNLLLGNVGSRYFNGYIDNLRLYNRTLSISEAKQLHLNPNAGLWVPDVTRYYIPAAGGADVRSHIIPAYMRIAA